MKINYNNEKEVASKAIEIARRIGANAVRAQLEISANNMYSVANRELERLQRADDRSLYIHIFHKGRYGFFSTNRLDITSIEQFVKDSVKMTEFLAQDSCRTLPNPDYYYKGSAKDLGQFDPYIFELPDTKRREIAFDCYNEIADKDKKLIYANSKYEDSVEYQYMVDSQGFEGESIQSFYTILMECSIEGENGMKPESYWYESAMNYKDFNPKGCATLALQRAKNKLGEKKIKGGRYNVIFDNTCSSRVVGPILNALEGLSIQQQKSFLKDLKDKKVFTDKLTIEDNPHLYGMSGSRYFDSEGIATKPINVIDSGVVTDYYINTYVSNKINMPITVDGPSSPTISTNSFSDEIKNLNSFSMIDKIGTGILITGINGGNCNDVTGDFSFGIEGRYFKNGTLQHPIREMNITGNIISLWDGFIIPGNDALRCSNWQIPSLAFENLTIL